MTLAPGMLALRHAVENASTEPVTDAQIVAILRGEGGNGSHIRAVFGDASLAIVAAAGRTNGVTMPTILSAYAAARAAHAAANPDLDAALAEFEALRPPVPPSALPE